MGDVCCAEVLAFGVPAGGKSDSVTGVQPHASRCSGEQAKHLLVSRDQCEPALWPPNHCAAELHSDQTAVALRDILIPGQAASTDLSDCWEGVARACRVLPDLGDADGPAVGLSPEGQPDLELDFLVGLEAPVGAEWVMDVGVVDEEFLAVLSDNEPVALGVVKPLNPAGDHVVRLPLLDLKEWY